MHTLIPGPSLSVCHPYCQQPVIGLPIQHSNGLGDNLVLSEMGRGNADVSLAPECPLFARFIPYGQRGQGSDGSSFHLYHPASDFLCAIFQVRRLGPVVSRRGVAVASAGCQQRACYNQCTQYSQPTELCQSHVDRIQVSALGCHRRQRFLIVTYHTLKGVVSHENRVAQPAIRLQAGIQGWWRG